MSAGEPASYASIAGQVAAISSRECVFRDARDRSVQVLPIAAVEALDACRAFAPLEQHARRLGELQPQLAPAAIAQYLEALVARRLSVSDAEFRRAPAETSPASPPRAIFLRACDRPSQLKRLLASLAANEKAWGRRHRYVLLDDSRDATAAEQHAALLAAFARETGAPAMHVGARRWDELVAR